MKILIIGNIGSGKTTLGNKIQEITGFKFVQIDELREKYLNNSVSGEYYSLYQFIKNIEENDNLILEFTGAGCHKFAIKRALELNDIKVMIILCLTREFSLIKKRAGNKKFLYTPPFDIDLEEHVKFINKELSNDLTNNFWNMPHFELVQFYMDDFNDLNSNIESIRDYLKKD